MKDEQIQNTLARLMIAGVVIAAAVMFSGSLWFVSAHWTAQPGDHIFAGEPKYLENPISMVARAFDRGEFGERRSVAMIGVVLLLLNPLVRVAFAAIGFGAQKDRLYTMISLIVLSILLISFFW